MPSGGMARLEPGVEVEVKGLRETPALNGVRGRVIGFKEQQPGKPAALVHFAEAGQEAQVMMLFADNLVAIPDSGVDMRVDTADGQYYTEQEFSDFYGPADGPSKWAGAPRFDGPNLMCPVLKDAKPKAKKAKGKKPNAKAAKEKAPEEPPPPPPENEAAPKTPEAKASNPKLKPKKSKKKLSKKPSDATSAAATPAADDLPASVPALQAEAVESEGEDDADGSDAGLRQGSTMSGQGEKGKKKKKGKKGEKGGPSPKSSPKSSSPGVSPTADPDAIALDQKTSSLKPPLPEKKGSGKKLKQEASVASSGGASEAPPPSAGSAAEAAAAPTPSSKGEDASGAHAVKAGAGEGDSAAVADAPPASPSVDEVPANQSSEAAPKPASPAAEDAPPADKPPSPAAKDGEEAEGRTADADAGGAEAKRDAPGGAPDAAPAERLTETGTGGTGEGQGEDQQEEGKGKDEMKVAAEKEKEKEVEINVEVETVNDTDKKQEAEKGSDEKKAEPKEESKDGDEGENAEQETKTERKGETPVAAPEDTEKATAGDSDAKNEDNGSDKGKDASATAAVPAETAKPKPKPTASASFDEDIYVPTPPAVTLAPTSTAQAASVAPEGAAVAAPNASATASELAPPNSVVSQAEVSVDVEKASTSRKGGVLKRAASSEAGVRAPSVGFDIPEDEVPVRASGHLGNTLADPLARRAFVAEGLERFYRKHNPRKADQAWGISARTTGGREGALYAKLVQRYPEHMRDLKWLERVVQAGRVGPPAALSDDSSSIGSLSSGETVSDSDEETGTRMLFGKYTSSPFHTAKRLAEQQRQALATRATTPKQKLQRSIEADLRRKDARLLDVIDTRAAAALLLGAGVSPDTPVGLAPPAPATPYRSVAVPTQAVSTASASAYASLYQAQQGAPTQPASAATTAAATPYGSAPPPPLPPQPTPYADAMFVSPAAAAGALRSPPLSPPKFAREIATQTGGGAINSSDSAVQVGATAEEIAEEEEIEDLLALLHEEEQQVRALAGTAQARQSRIDGVLHSHRVVQQLPPLPDSPASSSVSPRRNLFFPEVRPEPPARAHLDPAPLPTSPAPRFPDVAPDAARVQALIRKIEVGMPDESPKRLGFPSPRIEQLESQLDGLLRQQQAMETRVGLPAAPVSPRYTPPTAAVPLYTPPTDAQPDLVGYVPPAPLGPPPPAHTVRRSPARVWFPPAVEEPVGDGFASVSGPSVPSVVSVRSAGYGARTPPAPPRPGPFGDLISELRYENKRLEEQQQALILQQQEQLAQLEERVHIHRAPPAGVPADAEAVFMRLQV